jgi:hypothetical protein
MIEHVNGMVKGRFGSLKSLPTQIRDVKDFEKCNEWILVCLILYNLLINFNEDEWEIAEETEEAVNEFENNLIIMENSNNGKQLREKVQEKIVAWGFNRQQN